MCKYCEKTKIGLKEVFDGYSRRGLPKYKKVDNIDITQLDIISLMCLNENLFIYK